MLPFLLYTFLRVTADEDADAIVPTTSDTCNEFFNVAEIQELVSQHLGTCETCNNDADDKVLKHDLASMTDPTRICRRVCKSVLIRKNEERARADFTSDPWLEREKNCLAGKKLEPKSEGKVEGHGDGGHENSQEVEEEEGGEAEGGEEEDKGGEAEEGEGSDEGEEGQDGDEAKERDEVEEGEAKEEENEAKEGEEGADGSNEEGEKAQGGDSMLQQAPEHNEQADDNEKAEHDENAAHKEKTAHEENSEHEGKTEHKGKASNGNAVHTEKAAHGKASHGKASHGKASHGKASHGKAKREETSQHECRIRTYCELDSCQEFNDICHVIFRRELCKHRSRISASVDLDCFVELEAGREHSQSLTPDAAREIVHDAGVKAYNEAAQREAAVCEKVGVPHSQCSFDRAFEVQSQRDLFRWFNERAVAECRRLVRSSPSWLRPRLNCDICEEGGQKCDHHRIIARQMRIQYFKVRFVELLLILHGGQDLTPIGALEWAANYFGTAPGPECFPSFFQAERKAKGTYLNHEPSPPTDDCIDVLGQEMAMMLSVDDGAWYQKHAQKLFDMFFSPTDTEAALHVQPSVDASNRDLFYAVERVRNDARLEELRELNAQKAKDNVYYTNEDHSATWTVDVVKQVIKSMITHHDRTMPFILQDEEVRHILWMTHAFLDRVTTIEEDPNFTDIRTAIASAKADLEAFQARTDGVTTADDCAVAFYGDFNGASSLHRVARTVRIAPAQMLKEVKLLKKELLAKDTADKAFKTCKDLLDKKLHGKETPEDGKKSLNMRQTAAWKALQQEMHNVATLSSDIAEKVLNDKELGAGENTATAMVDEIVRLRFGPYLDELLGSLVTSYSHSEQHVPLHSTVLTGDFSANEDRLFTRFLDLKFRWGKFLNQPELWPEVVYEEVNDAGLEHRKKEMEFIQELCRIFKIDPYMAYTPPSQKLSSYYEGGKLLPDIWAENFDKQQCSLQHVLTRQYALKGRRIYEQAKGGMKHVPGKPTTILLDKFKFPNEKSEEDEKPAAVPGRKVVDDPHEQTVTPHLSVETKRQLTPEQMALHVQVHQVQHESRLLDREKP